MNKAIMMGRLTRDPVARYGASGNCVANFDIAVDRRFKREGQPTADFFRCTAFGKNGEFVEKYLKKGIKVVIEAEVQNDNYEKDGVKHYGTQLIVNQIEFAESKNAGGGNAVETQDDDGFMEVDDMDAEGIPFI